MAGNGSNGHAPAGGGSGGGADARIEVELITSQGVAHTGRVASAEFAFSKGTVQIGPRTPSYFTSFEHCTLRLETDGGEKILKLGEGFASLKANRLTVVAAGASAPS